MPDPSTLLVFATAVFVLVAVPGPAVLYIMARCIDQGRLAGFVSILGIAAGTIFHVVAAALGLSAVLMSSALAFNVVKYLGAAYLVYLGVRTLLDRREIEAPSDIDEEPLQKVFLQGVIVNLLNPKTALFFFAFLPQFVDPAKGAVAPQVIFLGVFFIALAMVSDAFWALVANSVGDFLKTNLKVLRAQRYFSGGVYVTLGVATALYSPSKA